ncbi:MAG: FHA domain-containing protein [Gammaproteobacteria bacterium]|nr:FHA domain-containing protein [Gammaproteobacteria bacterium]
MRKLARISLMPLILAVPVIALTQPETSTIRESVVQVVVMDGDEMERVGSGFAVAVDGFVLTAAHLVTNEDRIAVVPLNSGAELLARVEYINERADLALLAVNGLSLPPIKFAMDGFDSGRLVFSAGVWDESGESVQVALADEDIPLALAEGAVGKHEDLATTVGFHAIPLIEHNAMIPASGYGGPLLNECGEVAGLNRGSPGVTTWRLRRGQGPEDVVHAFRVTAIAGLLQPQDIAFIQSEISCEGALAVAQAEIEKTTGQLELTRQELEEATGQTVETQEQLERSRQELEEVTGQVEETQQQLEQIQHEREQAAAKAREAESRVSALEEQYQEAVSTGAEQTDALREELEAARGEQEMARSAVGTLESEVTSLEERLAKESALGRMRLTGVAVALVLVVLIVIILFIMNRRRSRQLAIAHEETEEAQMAAVAARAEARESASTFPDYLLSGETGAGRSVSLKIPGSLLSGDGAIIGRSPRNSTLLIDNKTLSREHARLFGEDDALYIEDLGSTNGTRVNDRKLEPGTPIAVSDGDVVELGVVKVELATAN